MPSTPAPSGPQLVVRNLPAPDDLALGLDARLYFSDITAGTVSALNPDGINPGQCEDLSNPPSSEQPGGGANCYFSMSNAAALCPDFTATGPYPAECANFNQLGVRVPFVAISPFSKRHYVSHTVGDHTSLLAFIETVFMGTDNGVRPHLTARDLNANPLLDLFDFNGSPSLNTPVDQTTPAFLDCTP